MKEGCFAGGGRQSERWRERGKNGFIENKKKALLEIREIEINLRSGSYLKKDIISYLIKDIISYLIKDF